MAAISLLKELDSTAKPINGTANNTTNANAASDPHTNDPQAFAGVLSKTTDKKTPTTSDTNKTQQEPKTSPPAQNQTAAPDSAAKETAPVKPALAASQTPHQASINGTPIPSEADVLKALKKILAQILAEPTITNPTATTPVTTDSKDTNAPSKTSATTDNNTAPTTPDPSSLLALLQQVMALYPPPPSGNSVTPNSTTDSTTPTTASPDTANSADPMTSLINWLQQVSAQTSTPPAPTPETPNTPPSVAPLPPMGPAPLSAPEAKKLLDQIKAFAKGQDGIASTDPQPLPPTATNDPTPPPKNPTPQNPTNTHDTTSLNDVLKLFTAKTETPPPSSPFGLASTDPFTAATTRQGDSFGQSSNDPQDRRDTDTTPSGFDNGTLNANTTNAKNVSPYSFASQLSATRAQQGGTTGLPPAVEQVILKINSGVKNGDNSLSIQLHPADLGRIDVKLDFLADGKVQGTIVADNQSTLDILQKDSRSLERSLQDAGLRTDPGSLQFSLGGQQQGRTWGQASPQNTAPPQRGGGTILPVDIDATGTTETYYVMPNKINLKV